MQFQPVVKPKKIFDLLIKLQKNRVGQFEFDSHFVGVNSYLIRLLIQLRVRTGNSEMGVSGHLATYNFQRTKYYIKKEVTKYCIENQRTNYRLYMCYKQNFLALYMSIRILINTFLLQVRWSLMTYTELAAEPALGKLAPRAKQ